MAEITDIPSFGFTGGIGSGKTTYANCLKNSIEKELGIIVYKLSVATKIVSVARDLFGIEVEDKVFREKYRRLMQAVAGRMREIDSEVWTNYLIREIKTDPKFPFIVENIRFKEEAIAFRQNFKNFILIRIKTDEKQRAEAYKSLYGRYYTEDENNDVTERNIADVPEDITWFNNYRKEDMEKQIADMVKSIKNGTAHELIKH